MVWVVGAVAIDVIALRERFQEGTSNPADIRLGLGGVGYRIFSNLEAPRRFITALGTDPLSRWAREALEADGDAVIQEVKGREAGPPLYLALMESGSLKVAASDFRVMEEALSPAFVERQIGELGAGDFLVLDANLSAGLLDGLVRRYAERTRVVFEPVSVEKSTRHAASLSGLFLMTPTVEEMEALAGGDIARFSRERCIRNILLTQGARGCSLFSESGRRDFPPGRVVEAPDTTGAGDLLLAALLSALHGGAGMDEAIRSAMTTVEERLGKGDM
jgi:sugar/nucleoside kinase (ribokinase family)